MGDQEGNDGYHLDQPAALTCPECGGALRTEMVEHLLHFRCHIGHVLTGETMLAAHFSILEAKLAACLMSLNERAELCRIISGAAPERERTLHEAARAQALERAQVLKKMLESEWVNNEPLSDSCL
jgi:two-component system chemotaxis response regulator CheB